MWIKKIKVFNGTLSVLNIFNPYVRYLLHLTETLSVSRRVIGNIQHRAHNALLGIQSSGHIFVYILNVEQNHDLELKKGKNFRNSLILFKTN